MTIRLILSLIFLMLVALAFTANTAAPKHRVALVIGNADYKTAALKNPVHDAVDVSKALHDSGFDVTLLKNINQEHRWLGNI